MKIIISTSSMVPIYEQIIDQIKTMIRKEELKQNDQLPSVRALSKELKISALTVKKAYDELEREGFTVTVHEKESYVAAANTELMMEEQRKEVEQDLEQAISSRALPEQNLSARRAANRRPKTAMPNSRRRRESACRKALRRPPTAYPPPR